MFGYKLIKQEQFEEMNSLISSLESFVSVAKTDGRNSAAVDFVDVELREYENKWGKGE
jgi:hypothetical protein